jgi:hypothetical protein
MYRNTTHLSQAEIDRIMLEAKRAQAQALAEGFRYVAAAARRGLTAVLYPLRTLAPRRRLGA